MLLLFLLTLREIIQLVTQRRAYIESLENWLEILLIIVTFISCSGVVASNVVKLHFSAIALFLGWLELLLLAGRLPHHSVNLEVLKIVTVTIWGYMASYHILLMAFALSFHILFKGSLEMKGTNVYAGPYLSLFKTTVMFTGDFDVSNLPFHNFPGTSHVIFLLFIFLAAIILFNVLSVAVSKAGKIINLANTLSLVARAKLISRIEEFVSVLPKFMQCGVIETIDMPVIYPDERNRISSTDLQSLLSVISKETKLKKQPEPSGSQEKWDMFTEKFSALQLRQDKTQQILMQILTRLDSRECERTHL